jgi:hypothetical protein
VVGFGLRFRGRVVCAVTAVDVKRVAVMKSSTMFFIDLRWCDSREERIIYPSVHWEFYGREANSELGHMRIQDSQQLTIDN